MKYNTKNMKKLDEWVKIDAQLQEKLNTLAVLNKKKDDIIKMASEEKSLSDEIKDEMAKNIKQYEQLAYEILQLKSKSKKIREEK